MSSIAFSDSPFFLGLMIFNKTLTLTKAMLISPNKDETAAHSCHFPGIIWL